VCGLKPWRRLALWKCAKVTPHAGVWIETYTHMVYEIASSSHTPRGCVDWNLLAYALHLAQGSHTPRGCVDWNYEMIFRILQTCGSHPTRVCGLKQSDDRRWNNKRMVTPHAGVWIETPYENKAKLLYSCHTPRGCVDWNRRVQSDIVWFIWSHPTRVCGLKRCESRRQTGRR